PLQVETPSAFPFDGLVGKNVEVHDPSVLEFGGTYLCFHTSGNSFCEMRTSKDLETWKSHGPILSRAPEWLRKQIPQQRSTWAPAAIKVGSTLRVYYCASERFGANGSVIGLVENQNFDPERPLVGWQDKGKLLESKAGVDNFNAIDPDVFVDREGRHWMAYGSYWGGLFMVELDAKTGLLKSPGSPPKHVASNTGERGNPLEAPVLSYHDGYYYLYVVYGLAAQGVRSTYRMMVGRSKSITDPFVGFDGKPMTEGGHTDVLKSSPPMFAPGGGNIFQQKDGKWMFAYHFYDGRKHWNRDVWGRPTMQIRDVLWAKDGWPLPGLPNGVDLKGPKRTVNIEGDWIHQADFANSVTIKLSKEGKVQGEGRAGSWSLKGDALTLTWPRPLGEGEPFVDQLQLAYDGRYYVGRNRAGAIIRGIRRDATTR
ncbi:MAG: arabinan endo-1,5-alpha-L-arabinosidase, partial [Chlorobia bacterium]|nr:arabinan endo-1,5-alpha-L-arabinosidase [Fimbriimonadaceae bacterium]